MSKPPNMIVPFKSFSGVSRICGLAKGMAGIETMEDFNKDGIVSGLKEIAQLAQEIESSAVMEKSDD